MFADIAVCQDGQLLPYDFNLLIERPDPLFEGLRGLAPVSRETSKYRLGRRRLHHARQDAPKGARANSDGPQDGCVSGRCNQMML